MNASLNRPPDEPAAPAPPLSVDAASWPEIVEGLVKPWPREAVIADLRWWTTTQGELPGRLRLAKRWGWSAHATKAVLRDRKAWLDRSAPPFRLSPRPGRVLSKASKSAKNGTRAACSPDASNRPTHLFLTPDAIREVRTIARGAPQFREALRRFGGDREELEQEIITRLLEAENTRDVVYDPARGSIGAYLNTRVRSIVAHMGAESRAKKRALVNTGAVQVDDGAIREVDVAQVVVGEGQRPVSHAVLDDLADSVLRGKPVAEIRRLARLLVEECGR